MRPAVSVLLLLLSGFLSGFRGVLPARTGTGRCSGAFCVFTDLLDFNGAETECRKSNGDLLSSRTEQLLDGLQNFSGLSGSFWLRSPGGRSGEAAEGLRSCRCVSVGLNVSVEWKSCSERLSGVLCEFRDICNRTRSSGGPVTYTTFSGFTLTESDWVPAGTTAEERPGGAAGPPAYKRLCASSRWMEAPWSCEVLGGGCEFACNYQNNTCTCPEGRMRHPNQVSCIPEPCLQSDCGCAEGFRRGQDGTSCVDVDECVEKNPCADEGQQCENLNGGFRCDCREDFILEDGRCVNVSICSLCEHMDCQKVRGEYRCVCRRGFRVSPADPTKCEVVCSERDCPARCEKNPEQEKKEQQQCFCPDGYILDIRNGTSTCTDIDECQHQQMCEQRCQNLFGGYRCWCDHGFQLQDGFRCVPVEGPGEEKDGGSGSGESSLPVAILPSYIRTGSILGIAVFLLLALAFIGFLVQNAARRCGRFEVPPLRRPDINIFYLQQVTTDTYKRLSLDK